MSKESFFSGLTTRYWPLATTPRFTSPWRSQARCSATSRSQISPSIWKSPTNCTSRCYKKNGRPKAPVRKVLLPLFLEAVNDVREHDRNVGAQRRGQRYAVLGARHAAPDELVAAGARVVLDRRVAESQRRALGEAMVVTDVVLGRTVVFRRGEGCRPRAAAPGRSAATDRGGYPAGVRALDVL